MISKAEILDEERIPREDLVVHRRGELDRLLTRLRPSETGPADLVYLVGPTGTGKTMLAKLTFRLLGRDESMPTHNWSYVSCWEHDDRMDILYQVVSELRDAAIHRNSTARTQLYDILDDISTDGFRGIRSAVPWSGATPCCNGHQGGRTSRTERSEADAGSAQRIGAGPEGTHRYGDDPGIG